ncbi:STAS domain-containing protein [Fodinibius sp. SL11]|uniref:STAS domain-containing protein n=1 Tax=Fodinibius sp. SL11 TaxID=3425690 RepID=UPI003F885A1D
MSIPSIHKNGSVLTVTIQSGFNLWVKNMIANHINDDIRTLRIDLTGCNYIDTEGVIYLYKWQKDGKSIELIDPPDIFFEILEILELDNRWHPNVLNRNEE